MVGAEADLFARFVFDRLGPRGAKADRFPVNPARLQFELHISGERLGPNAARFLKHFPDGGLERIFTLVQPSLGEVPALVGEIGIDHQETTPGVNHHTATHQPSGRGGVGVDLTNGIRQLIDNEGEFHPTSRRSRGTSETFTI